MHRIEKIIKLILPITFVGILLFVGINSAESSRAVRKYAIPDHGFLELTVPPSWKADVFMPQEKSYLIINFTPESRNEFQVWVSVLWDKGGGADFDNQDKLKSALEKEGMEILSQIVETEIVSQEIKGVLSTGYYFSVTDKAPKPGDYPYMTRGTIGAGNLILNLLVLYRNKESESVKEALSILREARQLEK